eukprot:12902004-Prorocentrum_lima.AAC.1
MVPSAREIKQFVLRCPMCQWRISQALLREPQVRGWRHFQDRKRLPVQSSFTAEVPYLLSANGQG